MKTVIKYYHCSATATASHFVLMTAMTSDSGDCWGSGITQTDGGMAAVASGDVRQRALLLRMGNGQRKH